MATKKIRENAGFIIEKAEVYTLENNTPKREVVLGRNPKTNEYVTWECTDGWNYFWGHYFTKNEKDNAYADYHYRLAKYYE